MEQLGNRVLKILFILVWVIAVVNAAAEYWFWYWKVLWLDIPMHFLGGVWVGLAGIWLWRHSVHMERVRNRMRISNFYIALLFGIAIGLVWESYEYVIWRYSGKGFPAQYIPDLQLDLVMDVLGALAGYMMYRFLARKGSPQNV